MNKTNHRSLTLAPARVERTETADGVVTLRSPVPLAAPPQSLGSLLRRGAETYGDCTLLAERRPGVTGSW